MQIIKQDGSEQTFLPNKIYKRIKKQSKGLNVDVEAVFKDCVQGVVNGMSTKDIDELIALSAANKVVKDPHYSKLASRIILTRQGKIIGKEPIDSDFLYDFFGISSFLHKYSLRDDDGNPMELPHMMYKRVADHLWGEEYKENRDELYEALRWQRISLATPILINSGTSRGSKISCEITTLEEDSKEGILNTLNKASMASSGGAGLGLHIHNLRSAKTLVASFKGKAGGVTRFADMAQSHMRFFKQGKRSGAAALYLGVWHADISDFLDLRMPTMDPVRGTPDLFTSVCLPDLFMEKLINGDDSWHIFCPHQVKLAGFKPLHETHGDAFKKQYDLLVSQGLGEEVSLKNIWFKILRSQSEAGVPYIFFWDNANKNYQQRYLGLCTGSNLCSEYVGKSAPGMSSQCDLGLINLAKTNLDEVPKYTKILVKALNRVIDKNVWSHEWAKKGGESQRTIGIGVAGLADYAHRYGKLFVGDLAIEENEVLFKRIYQNALEGSHEYSVKHGVVFDGWEKSPYKLGGYQGDMEFKDYKVANSLLVAPMPSASTSVLLGVNECFEPYYSNVFVRKVDVAEFVVVNKWLVQELKDLGLWNPEMREKILAESGSVQNIPEIPESVRVRYKTIWEYSQKDMIDLAAARQKWIDQAQSFNVYYSDPSYAKMGATIKYAWEKGLKTIYYSRTRNALGKAKRLSGGESKTENKTSATYDNGHEVSCFGCSA